MIIYTGDYTVILDSIKGWSDSYGVIGLWYLSHSLVALFPSVIYLLTLLLLNYLSFRWCSTTPKYVTIIGDQGIVHKLRPRSFYSFIVTNVPSRLVVKPWNQRATSLISLSSVFHSPSPFFALLSGTQSLHL